jgi:hypothetical protein
MIARPGDAIVKDAQDLKDAYRVQEAAFAAFAKKSGHPRTESLAR